MKWFPKMPRLYGTLSGSQKPVTQGRVVSEWPPSAFPRLFGECCSLGTGGPLLAAWSSLSSIPQSNPPRRSGSCYFNRNRSFWPVCLLEEGAGFPPGGCFSAVPSVPNSLEATAASGCPGWAVRGQEKPPSLLSHLLPSRLPG